MLASIYTNIFIIGVASDQMAAIFPSMFSVPAATKACPYKHHLSPSYGRPYSPTPATALLPLPLPPHPPNLQALVYDPERDPMEDEANFEPEVTTGMRSDVEDYMW